MSLQAQPWAQVTEQLMLAADARRALTTLQHKSRQPWAAHGGRRQTSRHQEATRLALTFDEGPGEASSFQARRIPPGDGSRCAARELLGSRLEHVRAACLV